MEIKLYLRMLRRGWWIIVLTALLAVNVALLASYFTEPTYLASAKFIVSPNPSIVSDTEMITSLEALDKRSIVATYAEFLGSRRVYLEALQALNLEEAEMEDYKIATVVLPEANILELTVTGSDARLVASLANTIGQLAISYISRLYRAYDVSVFDSAVAPLIPISPQPVRDTGLALALGLIAGASLAIVSEQIRAPLDTYRQRLRMDHVTGVFNDRHFRRLLEDELAQNPNDILSIGIVELTGIQEYLETLPFAALQVVLRRVTDVLRKELRGHDIIGRWTEIGFAILLPNTPGVAANRTFDRIFQALKNPMGLDQYGFVINLDPHIGGSVYSNYITSDELLDQAKSALEQARRGSGDPVYVWEMKNPFWVDKGPVQ